MNIWFVWAKTLYNGEKVRCCACDTQTNTHVKLVQIAVFWFRQSVHYQMKEIHCMMECHHMMECYHMMNTHNIEYKCCIFSASPGDIFTPSCLDPHWPAGRLRSKHISYILFMIWWTVIILWNSIIWWLSIIWKLSIWVIMDCNHFNKTMYDGTPSYNDANPSQTFWFL